MLHAVMQEQRYWKSQKQKFRKENKKLLISLEPHLYEKLEELALYNENLDQIALELITEGLDYIYMEDVPVQQSHAFQHFIEFELTPFQHKLLQQLALKRGCSTRKMAYTILRFMLRTK
ncbi:hypothetical protein P4G85_15215 [Bacillus cereus]|uniref:Uncharacterized protein n=2 Tax=Bacillus cereus group TaxID=86661 RepID=A0A9W5NZ61_BACCE|nr:MULTISPECIES: hypothetical protein [Bacillus cereus group]MEB8732281.1 hypothetical protein [Bacillus cereus]EEM44243.1 hypothetical protein bthur0005_60530 [Bacillus thuringiensis serovar pakistani str. T13001]EJR60933.1 hypothetical protein IK5_06081 [Bacillus cereus VD154]KIU74642.1 hypothetical protein C797_11896 [Bacillus thuringiensis Sbt003]MEB8749675.1 hypothetical protein [Bacillus cereus]